MHSGAGLAALAALVFAMFFEALVAPGARVLGAADTDAALQFLAWREFGFGELARGNLALWNPHIYAGAPFLGGMQSALLYPVNWLHLVLPLPLAINWTIALNVWLLGAFMYAWALRRGIHPFAALVAAAVAMFCAPHFLRIHAGHLAALAAMPWIPLVLLAIDEWLAARRAAWCLIGMLAVALQILAGHPQYVYFTAIVAGLYALFGIVALPGARLAAAAGPAGFYAGGGLLAAAQLLPGIQAASEAVRSARLPYEFATALAFPPESLVTLLVPGFFGDLENLRYWGRWLMWEGNAFVGVIALALAIYGIAAARARGKRALLAVAAVATVLALGQATPLHRVLYDWLPLFDRFRGTGKFIVFSALILALFAGYGLDRILRSRTVPWLALAWGAAAAALLCAAAVAIRWADWRTVSAAIAETGQSYAHAARATHPAFVSAAQAFASLGTLYAGLTLVAAVCAAYWTRREPRAAFVLGALAIAEVFAFARMHRPMFDSERAGMPELREFLAADPGDYRILNFPRPNSAMSMGAFDLWGYDPVVARRYAELMHWIAGADPAAATQYLAFRRFDPLLSMLRLKYIVSRERGDLRITKGNAPPLRRLELIGKYRVHSDRAEIFRAMGEPSFDPAREVILEREPQPAPGAGAVSGHATLTREGTDYIEIAADLKEPAILLVTDAWTPGWSARALDPGSQARYELMPANYALRAVALERGRHRLRIEYSPAALRAGTALSALAALAWAAVALRLWRRGAGRAHA